MSDKGLETFKKRPGSTDRGKDYEHVYICTLILKLITEFKVKNFQLSSNDNNFGVFDDVVVEIEFFHSKKTTYLIQLKHSNIAKALTKNSLADKRGNFSIKRYFEDSVNLNLDDSFKYVLFTNFKFDTPSGVAITLADDACSISTKIDEDDIFLSTCREGRCYQFTGPETKYEQFFKNFYLYTNQASVSELKHDTKIKFRQSFHCEDDIFEQYLQFVTQWSLIEGNKNKLNKDLMVNVIALRLLAPYIVPWTFSDEEVTANTIRFRQAMSKFHVTCFESGHCEKVKRIWSDVKKGVDIKNLNKVNKKYQVTPNSIASVDGLDDRDCTKLFWLMGLCPLPILTSTSFEKVAHLCKNNFVLFGDASNANFQKLDDLDADSCTNIIKHFRCSLQGKDDITLETLFTWNEKIRSIITTNELVQMLEEPLNIGGKKEILPIPHIDRRLTRNIINLEFLNKINSDTLTFIGNVKEQDEEKIRNSSINNINLIRMEDFWKGQVPENEKCVKDVFFTDGDCSREEVENIFKELKKKRRYHQFRLFEGELEWVRSQGDILEFKELRIGGKYVEQSELFAASCDEQVNIVCADPGMGKSILMKNLKNSSKDWCILIQPKDHSKYFRSKNSQVDDFVKYIVEKHSCDKFVGQLLDILVQDRQILFIWDGLDEAATENLSMIVEIINQLSLNGFTQWLTSRCNLKTALESKFGVLSRTVEQFDSAQQNSYIEKRLNCSKNDLDDIKTKIHVCIRLVQYNDILGIPLQIYMFTELFRQNPDKYKNLLSSIFSITDLYRHFVDEKFNIYYKAKAYFDDSNDLIVQILERTKKEQLKLYEKAALATYLEPEILDTLRINCDDFLETIQTNSDCFGIIVDVTDDEVPCFLHNSYGEFFAAAYLHKNYRKLSKLDWIFEERCNNIRFLFDLLMAEDCPAHIAVLYKNVQVLKKYEDCIGKKDEGGRSPLHLACSWGKRFDVDGVQKKDTDLEVTKVDAPDYQQIVTFLSDRCDPFDNDSLFQMDCFHYGDYSHNLLPVLILSNKHRVDFKTLKNFSDVNTVLYNAVKLDYSDIFEEIPFVTIDDQRSLLHVSVIHESVSCLDKILKNPDYKQCLNAPDRNGVTPFLLACRSGNLRIIRSLMGAGADISATTSSGYSGVYIAARAGHPEVIRALLDAGVDINAANHNGQTAFFLACQAKSCPMVRMLMDFGADVNLADRFGYTPLYMACRRRDKDMIKLLLDNGGDVNAGNVYGDRPLFMAASSGQLEVVRWLLEAGADIDGANKKGHGAIHAFCLHRSSEGLHFLIEQRCDVNKANKYGQTPLHIAVRQHFENGIVLLLKAGADDKLVNRHGESFWEIGCRYYQQQNFGAILATARGGAYLEEFKQWCKGRLDEEVTQKNKTASLQCALF